VLAARKLLGEIERLADVAVFGTLSETYRTSDERAAIVRGGDLGGLGSIGRNLRATPDREPPKTRQRPLLSLSHDCRANEPRFSFVPHKEKDSGAPPSFSFFRHASCQNEMRAFSWNCRGPIVVVVILDELVGAPLAKATPVFGSPKLGWLKML
jgi:hypothetical protein